MAKNPSSAIGIDLGRHTVKSVLLHRKGAGRYAISHYATRTVTAEDLAPQQLGTTISGLLGEMGGSAKACCVAASSKDAILRLIQQPETPTELLRTGIRLNGPILLNQDVRNYVLDCAKVIRSKDATPLAAGQSEYLVGGLPREKVMEIYNAFESAKLPLNKLQLAPVSAFNAFQFAKPEVFDHEPFILVDMGHEASTVTVAAMGQLVLVRAIEYGGRELLEALASFGASTGDVFQGLENEDHMLVETARMSLAALTREVSSSIGFFEGRREQTISHIFVSGGLARSQTLLNLMSEELRMPCEAWHAFERCELAVAPNRKAHFAQEAVNLGVACGAAVELLRRQD